MNASKKKYIFRLVSDIRSMEKYLLLLPIAFLLLNAYYYMHVTREIQRVLLDERFVELVSVVDMISAIAETDIEYKQSTYEETVYIAAVEFIDKLNQVYAGLYKMVDNEPTLISKRYYETSTFEPFDFPDFTTIAFSSENGYAVIGYTPEMQTYRELHLYYRWMPEMPDSLEHYLIVAGVSQHSVATTISLWVSIGQWISMALTLSIQVWLIIRLTQLGYIYEQRTGDKWRSKRRTDR